MHAASNTGTQLSPLVLNRCHLYTSTCAKPNIMNLKRMYINTIIFWRAKHLGEESNTVKRYVKLPYLSWKTRAIISTRFRGLLKTWWKDLLLVSISLWKPISEIIACPVYAEFGCNYCTPEIMIFRRILEIIAYTGDVKIIHNLSMNFRIYCSDYFRRQSKRPRP